MQVCEDANEYKMTVITVGQGHVKNAKKKKKENFISDFEKQCFFPPHWVRESLILSKGLFESI